MSSAISQATWHGQKAWVLESNTIRTVVVPELGAKLVSLIDKRTGYEWLVGPGDRPLKKVPYGASFVDQDMSGWDEMLPTIVVCAYPAPGQYHGVPLPDHGEIWSLPWTVQRNGPNTLKMSVEGKALPYRFTRTLSYSAPDTLQMEYKLENLSREQMPFIWAAHPQFVCNEGAEIVLPSHVRTVCNTLPVDWGWGEPESRFNWPDGTNMDENPVRVNRTGPATLNQARKFFVVPEAIVGWAGLIRQPAGDWVRLEWEPVQVPYLGVWVDEGKISDESVVALEPMTGFYDSLDIAWQKKRVPLIEPGEIRSWTVSVILGTGEQPFSR